MTMHRSKVENQWESRPGEPLPIPLDLQQELHLKVLYEIGSTLITGLASSWGREGDMIRLTGVVLIVPMNAGTPLAKLVYTFYSGITLIRVPLVIMPWSHKEEQQEVGGDGNSSRS